MPSPVLAQDASFVAFTKAERIQQLNNIDKSITQLLKSAGVALQILVSTKESTKSITERKQDFEEATDTYLSTLQTVDVGLKRQIWGLEEAEIIADKKMKEGQEPKIGSDAKHEKDLEGGTGKLDIGWLNSRSGKVGRDNEAELWRKARSFLENVEENWGKEKGDGDGDGNSVQDMGS